MSFGKHARLSTALQSTGLNYEIVYVNDSSEDNTLPILSELQIADDRVRVVSFARNFGHQVAATVGTILKQIENRVPLAGKFVVSFIGMAWAVVTYMVVPILAAETLGPFAAVKRSASLLRKTWGESLVGQVSLGAVQFVFMLPVILGLLVAGYFSVATQSIWPIAVVGFVAVPFIILLSIAVSTLQQIFLAAVYQYAAEGTVPFGFSQDLIASAFQPKEKK
jgi:hypothetical protein